MAYQKISTILFASALLSAGVAFADSNGGAGRRDLPVHTARANNGQVLCTAAINTDGTIATQAPAASYINPAKTIKLSTGQYQVGFIVPCNNIVLANGWFRVVQPDTLESGALAPGSSCTVADRSGEPSAPFIRCAVGTTETDMSFTVQVSR
jgi:hypothetical protein